MMLQSTLAPRLDRLPLRECGCHQQRQRKQGSVHDNQSLSQRAEVTAEGEIELQFPTIGIYSLDPRST
jgi:hypothetical protein